MKPLILNEIYIPRISSSENTAAFLRFDYKEKISSSETFNLFKTIVSHWVEHSDNGKQDYDDSCNDFNIDDLSSSLIFRDDIVYVFEKHGVFNIKIDVICEDEPNSWSFDNCLV